MGGNQIVSPVLNNAIIYGTTTDPGSGSAGQLYYNTSTNLLKYWNGTSWQALTSSTTATSVANALSTGTGLSYTTGTTFDGSAARTINLSNTSVSAGSYGSSTQIPTFTVDAQGRLTAAGTASISTSISLGAGTGSGNVSGGGTLTISGGTGVSTSVTGSTFTISLPQAISTTSTPTFNQITINNSPANATDVATKQYVDNIASGINAHDAVVAATTAPLTVTYNNNTTGVGATLTNAGTQATLVIDNVTPVVNDRILVKNQASGSQNGIYTVTNVGSSSTNWVLTRATDYDNSTAGEVASGDTVFVVAPASEFSTTPTNQNTGWTMNSAGIITIGVSPITFAQSSGTGTVTATNGLTIVTGNQVGVNLGSAFDSTSGTGTSGLSIGGGTLQVRLSSSGGLTSSTSGLAINTPGTGLTLSGNSLVFASGTTSQAATGVSGGAYSYATQKQTATITLDGTTTSWAIAHNLNSRDVQVQVYQSSAGPDTQYAEVEADIVRTSTSSVTITFASAGTSGNTYNVVIVG